MIDLNTIRKNIIISLFTDDDFFDTFVLKGGNALMFHGINDRASKDIDVSMESDFDIDLEEVRKKLDKALNETFYRLDYHVIDVRLTEKPKDNSQISISKWGGYELTFKIVSNENYDIYANNLEKLRRVSECISEESDIKNFSVDISKYEYCEPKMETEIDKFPIYIYTPKMILFEKLRAICQQHKEYNEIMKTHRSRPRARDFFDIYSILQCNLELKSEIIKKESLEELQCIFDAKSVPLNFLEIISEYRSFHFVDWSSVQETVYGKIESYDFYFDRVLDISESLCEALIDLKMMDSIVATA